jgi:hypothetical protein
MLRAGVKASSSSVDPVRATAVGAQWVFVRRQTAALNVCFGVESAQKSSAYFPASLSLNGNCADARHLLFRVTYGMRRADHSKLQSLTPAASGEIETTNGAMPAVKLPKEEGTPVVGLILNPLTFADP